MSTPTARQPRPCQECGRTFHPFPARVRYCSKACGYKARRRARLLRPDAIELSNGEWALVSPEDVEYLRNYGWVITPTRYARRGATKHTSMHRAVMERMVGRSLLGSEHVDHINHDTLDNRRSNLRLATHSENLRNQSRLPGVAGRVGVSPHKARFRSYLTLNYQQIHIGVFDTADEAGWMRDQWSLALHGEFGRLNFEYIFPSDNQGGDNE